MASTPNLNISRATSNGTVFQAESKRLEKSIEDITRRFEHEKRSGTIIEQSLKELRRKVTEQKHKLPNPDKQAAQAIRQMRQITKLEEMIGAEKQRLSVIMDQNKRTRDHVDELRLAITRLKRESNQTIDTIRKAQSQAILKNRQAVNASKKTLNYNQNIIRTHRNLLENKTQFSQQLSFLESQILDDKQSQVKTNRKDQQQGLIRSNASEVVQLCRFEAQKLEKRVFEKRKQYESYKKHAKKLKSGITQMVNDAGISDYKELLNQYITYHEDNTQLQKYLSDLSKDVEELEIEIRSLQANIQKKSNLIKTGQGEENQIKTQCKRKLDKLTEQERVKTNQASQLANKLRLLQPILQELEQCWEDIGIDKPNNNPLEFSNEMELTERNLTEYLNGLEEQASTFMVLLRKLNNDPHASMGFLRLQDLQEKIHSKALDINLEDISDPEDSDLKPKKGTEFQLMAKANLSKIK